MQNQQKKIMFFKQKVYKFGTILMEKGKKMDLMELEYHNRSSKILIKIAEDLKELNVSLITLKKINVFKDLEIESFKTNRCSNY